MTGRGEARQFHTLHSGITQAYPPALPLRTSYLIISVLPRDEVIALL